MPITEDYRTAAAGDTSGHLRSMVANDGVRSNLCGRGVRTTLQALGIPVLSPEQTGAQDGHRWDDILTDPRMREAGWEEVDWKQMGWSPENSPPGVVWVYGHNEPRPDTNVDKTGRAFGHVEIALEDGYVAGGFANNPGGSVRHNTPRAFVHPQLTALFESEGAVPEDFARASVERAADTATEERRRREGDAEAQIYRDNLQNDIDQVDFSNITLMDLLNMIINIITGQPINAPALFREHAGSDVPDSEGDPPANGNAVNPVQPDGGNPETPDTSGSPTNSNGEPSGSNGGGGDNTPPDGVEEVAPNPAAPIP